MAINMILYNRFVYLLKHKYKTAWALNQTRHSSTWTFQSCQLSFVPFVLFRVVQLIIIIYLSNWATLTLFAISFQRAREKPETWNNDENRIFNSHGFPMFKAVNYCHRHHCQMEYFFQNYRANLVLRSLFVLHMDFTKKSNIFVVHKKTVHSIKS